MRRRSVKFRLNLSATLLASLILITFSPQSWAYTYCSLAANSNPGQPDPTLYSTMWWETSDAIWIVSGNLFSTLRLNNQTGPTLDTYPTVIAPIEGGQVTHLVVSVGYSAWYHLTGEQTWYWLIYSPLGWDTVAVTDDCWSWGYLSPG